MNLSTQASKDLRILENCIIFLNLKHYEIGKVYVFLDSDRYKVEETGKLWIEDYVNDLNRYKGYMYCPLPSLNFDNDILSLNAEKINIIGYAKKRKYLIYGVNISDSTTSFNESMLFSADFNFLEFKRIID